jgi:hypothetical protein
MKRQWLIGLFLVVFSGGILIMMPGCSEGDKEKIEELIKKNKDKILVALKRAAQAGTEFGLKKWAKKDPAAAKEAATALARNLKEEILPYLDGEELHTSAEISEFIDSSLFKDVPEEVKAAIVSAAVVLDLYLPIPGSENLTEDQRDYLKAFLGGIQAGAAKFANDNFSVDKRYWITGADRSAPPAEPEKEDASAPRNWIAGQAISVD